MKNVSINRYPTEINVLFVASLYSEVKEPSSSLCLFFFTETLSILGDGREEKKKNQKKKVHFCSWKSLVDLINLIVLGIFDIPTCLHTTAATCCHLKSKYRITANWDFIVYHAYFRNYFCKVKMTLTLKACVIKPQQSVCWVCTYYVLIIKRKM